MWGCLKFMYKASNWTMLSQTKACTTKLSWADERKNRPLCSISSSDPQVLSFYIPLKWQATSPSCVPNGIKQSYDAKFKLTVINYDKKMNNCNTATKFSVVESNILGWRQQKQKLINVNSIQKSFSGPKNGYFQASEQWTVEFVYQHKKLEGWSHVKQLNIKHGSLPNHKSCGFSSRPGWVGMCDAEEQVLSL